MTMLMVSTTGEQHAFYRLDETLRPIEAELPEDLRESVERITENCEPALCTVLFMAGAGGSLRAGVTENPVRLTRSVRQALTTVTAGGAPVYVWPGGGITFMVDVTLLPRQLLRLRADAGASSRRSNSRCGSTIMPRSAAMSTRCGRSKTSSPARERAEQRVRRRRGDARAASARRKA